MELKQTDISSEKILKLETSPEKTGQSWERDAPTLFSKETAKSELPTEDDDLRGKYFEVKVSPKEIVDMPPETTSKKSLKKMSLSSNETVELKSSPEKISTSLQEAKRIEVAAEIVSSLPDEVRRLKASSESTKVSLEEPEKSKPSFQNAPEEIVLSKVISEKTDVLSKDIIPSEKATIHSEEITNSQLSSEKSLNNKTMKLQSEKSPEKTVSSKKTVKSKAPLQKIDTLEDDIKPTSTFEETSVMPTEVKPGIPLKKKQGTDLRQQVEQSRKISISEADSDSSQSISDIPTESDSKPNIPDKTKRSRPKAETVCENEGSRRRRPKPEIVTEDEVPLRRRFKPETMSEEDGSQRYRHKAETVSEDEGSYLKAPALPRKRSKRDSSTESLSSSIFLSSSSESLSSFETASLKESDSLPSKTNSSVFEDAPEIPARKAKVKSSPVRQRKRDHSEDSSSASAASKSSVKSCDLPPKETMDLCRKRTSIDERMIKLQNEGKCNTKEKAFIAAKLIEMQFEEEDALLASRQCSSVYHAIKFLTQLCEMCNCRFPINLMASMVYCTHRACKECFKAHFTSLIYDRSIFTLLCPICNKPDITDQNIQEYFNHLDMLFRNILDSHVYDLFQRKLRDEVLTKDPNFHWCSQCSSGFIASPRLKKLYCPDCSAITCALCHQTWELEHEGVHCERFQQWKDMHTPEPPPAGLVKYLADRGITCPSCELVYPQACGGCLMYKCSHCSFEFCGFCSKPYKRGKDCGNKSCESRGLHSHHPYSCLFFLRDVEMSDLQMLLEEESVTYLTIPPKDQIVKSRCQVREQKHIHGSISEDRCGRDIVPYFAGLCRTHYYEYLTELFRENKINPLPIMTTHDLQFILRKSRVLVPDRVKGETNDDYYKRLTEVVSSTLT